MLAKQHSDTIAAIATPPGRGGVGIIRVSGPNVTHIAQQVLGFVPKLRKACYVPFYDRTQTVVDEGIALYFKAPHSFTGEDVLELQAHGGPVILDMMLNTVLQLGARVARPGEFSERAFLNDKIDLTQAEAIADLIDASSEQAARSAVRSLQGEFSKQIHHLVDQLIKLRMFVEAAIDFPEEEIDFLSDGQVQSLLATIKQEFTQLLDNVKHGALLREGMTVVIAGKPNAGKSSLLNCLAGQERAIVTDIAGTTRDILQEHIQINGVPIHIIDTAGLRETEDTVEKIGIERAWQAIQQADHLLLITDASEAEDCIPAKLWPLSQYPLPQLPTTVIRNKVDLLQETPSCQTETGLTVISLSAKQQQGIELLRDHLAKTAGLQQLPEGQFIARRRHLHALEQANAFVLHGEEQLLLAKAGELLAEDLRQAQQQLGEITGEFSADDLLGEIFSQFCIGK